MSNTQVYTQQFQFPSASTTQPYNYYTPSRGTSPSSSATATPLTSSPTSPHQAHRKMNTPAYVPAVLRPNVQEPRRIKKNPGSAQSTPPGSQSGSLESCDGFPSDTTSIRRRDTMESGKWGLGRMVETSNTGAGPTRDHWKVNSPSSTFYHS